MSGLFCKMQGYSINNSKDSCFFPLHVCKLCTKAKQIGKYIEQGNISQFNESFTYLMGCVNIIYGQTLYNLSTDITMLVGILTTLPPIFGNIAHYGSLVCNHSYTGMIKIDDKE